MSKRFSILDRLRDNWPGQFDHPRIAFIEKELRDFDEETLDLAVTHVLRTETFPPKLAAFFAKCREIKQSREKKEREKKPVPGDVVDGHKTLTPLEALEELKRMKREHPEAFIDEPTPMCNPTDSEATKRRFQAMTNRWYVVALHRCIAWDASIKVPDELRYRKRST